MQKKSFRFVLWAVVMTLLAVAAAPVVIGTLSAPAASAFATVDGTDSACRIMPECSSDSDCNALCASGGKCIHSKCPIRICRCN
jgi:hypothetical protein